MDSGEREMSPVPMTMINPQKEYWPSWGWNQRPLVLKSATLPTEPEGLALRTQDCIVKVKIKFIRKPVVFLYAH